MPIFDYRCSQCGHTFDALQKLGEPALTQCPECGKAALDKLVSTPAFQVKGKHQGGARQGAGSAHSHDHGHSHSHGGHSHTHGPGCGHKH